MKNASRKIPLSKDAQQMLRGVIVGELLTILIIGGLWLWLRPRLSVNNGSLTPIQVANTSNTTSNFESVTNVPVGAFKYGGSTAWVSIRQLVDSHIQNTRPELQLQYVDPTRGSPGSTAGIKMLLDGKLDFAQSSRPLTAEEQALAKQRGFTLEQREVGTDGIAVAVNRKLQIPGLTVEQLQQIYLGKITNWKQVGGSDLAIAPLSLYPENADTILFSDKPVLKQTFGSNVKYIYSTTEALRQVNKIPGAIYYGSARGIIPQCTVKVLPLGLTATRLVSPYRESSSASQCPPLRKRLDTEVIKNGSYPLKSKLFVIIKQNNGPQQQAGSAYTRLLLTSQGQKAIEQAHFVPIR